MTAGDPRDPTPSLVLRRPALTQGHRLAEAASAFQSLAALIYGADSYDAVFEAICRAAVAAVPGCDHATIVTMRAGERSVCEAASDDVARRVHELEVAVAEGPCLDAIRTQRFECDPDITRSPSWPRLAECVVTETSVRGMVGYRILVGDRKAGALMLLSDTPGALTPEAGSIGAIVAAFASVALSAAAEQQSARSLREALDSNREIGKAIGLLMATNGMSDEEAFNALRDASSKLNLRLAVVARRVVADHNGESDVVQG